MSNVLDHDFDKRIKFKSVYLETDLKSIEEDVTAIDFLNIHRFLQDATLKRDIKQLQITSKLSGDPFHLLDSDLMEVDMMLENMYDQRERQMERINNEQSSTLFDFGKFSSRDYKKDDGSSFIEAIVSAARDEQILDEMLMTIKSFRILKWKNRRKENSYIQDTQGYHSNNFATSNSLTAEPEILTNQKLTPKQHGNHIDSNRVCLTREFLKFWTKPVELRILSSRSEIPTKCLNGKCPDYDKSLSENSIIRHSIHLPHCVTLMEENKHNSWEVLYCAGDSRFNA